MGRVIAFWIAATIALVIISAIAPYLPAAFVTVVTIAFCIGVVKGFGKYYQALVSIYGKTVGLILGVVFTLIWLAAVMGIVVLVVMAVAHVSEMLH